MNMARVEQLLEMIKLEPFDPFCRYALALEYASDIQFVDKAIEELVSLRQLKPDYLPLYFQLAMLLQKSGRMKEAVNVAQVGAELAHFQQNRHAFSELNGLLEEMDDD